jgi:acyl carrier protein phosphodiesterase
VNHLAHALVAVRTGTSIVGNLMGDFAKGRPEDRWSGQLLEGIRLHRRVDALTDDHPAFSASRARLRPELRRWAGVLVDLYWDHVLARAWDDLGEDTLRAFADRVYGELAAARVAGGLPGRMPRFVDYLVSTDLLVAYREPAGIARALAGLATRTRRPSPLAGASADLEALRPGLESDFRAFWPDLLATLGAGPARPSGSGG